MLRGDGADKRKSLELLDVGRKRGRRRKRALPANIDRGVSLQIIASDRKKRTISAIGLFPNPSMHSFSHCSSHWTKPAATLGDTCGRCFVGSRFHLGSKWNFKILPGLKHGVFLQRQFYLVSPHAKVKSWGQRVDEMKLLKLWRVCGGRTDGVA